MIQFQRILCPIDFSETSDRGLRHATALASWYEAQLTVLHVVPCFDESMRPSVMVPQDGLGPFPSPDDVITEIRRALERTEATTVGPAPLAEEGRVHEVIVKRAGSLPADLIVLGTHGRSGYNRLFLGSVTEKVLRTASCPVLTVPPSAPAGAPGPVMFKKILCPIDFSPSSSKALQYALELGRQANGCVMVLHVVEYLDPEASLELSVFDPCRQSALDSRRRRQQLIDRARERLHAQVAGESTTWCEIEEVVAINRAYKEILQRATASEMDLIVMGAQGSSGIELMLYGSNTHHVVRHATCPVLTVRASGGSD